MRALGPVCFTLGILACACGCQRNESSIPSEPIYAEVSLSTNVLHVGDRVTLALNVYHPPEGSLTIPELARDPEFVVRDLSMDTLPLTEDRALTTYLVDFTSFSTGQHVVATNIISFLGLDGAELTTPFPFVDFDVVSLLTTNTEVRGVSDYVSWDREWPRWIIALLLVIALAIILSLILVALTVKARKSAESIEPSIPPDVLALARLNALQEKGYIDAQAHEPFYVELSDIVRNYLEGRFSLHAPDRTTEEFLREAADTSLLSPEHQQLTRSFLEQCDLVKFARFEPDRLSMTNGFEAARDLVLETRKTPEEEEAA